MPGVGSSQEGGGAKLAGAVPGGRREQGPESLRAQRTFSADSRLPLQAAHIFSFGLRYEETRRKSPEQRLMLRAPHWRELTVEHLRMTDM